MTLEQIHDMVRKRMKELEPALAEFEELYAAEQALQNLMIGPVPREVMQRLEAPYGLKADGTPRKRPAPTSATQKKAHAAKRAKRNKSPNVMKHLKLNVQTVTGPTEDEMKDRELAHASSS